MSPFPQYNDSITKKLNHPAKKRHKNNLICVKTLIKLAHFLDINKSLPYLMPSPS